MNTCSRSSPPTPRLRGAIGKNALDEPVMTAMGEVPRHEFVPIELQPYAYDKIPLPIGFAKTISQPFVVALMTDLLDIKANDNVLEIPQSFLECSTSSRQIPSRECSFRRLLWRTRRRCRCISGRGRNRRNISRPGADIFSLPTRRSVPWLYSPSGSTATATADCNRSPSGRLQS